MARPTPAGPAGTGGAAGATGAAGVAVPAEPVWQTLLAAGVGLVFLGMPALALLQSPATPALRLLGAAALAAFVVVYLTAYVRPRPLAGRPLWVSTLAYSGVLLGATALMVPAAGLATLYTLPYFAAVWLFIHPFRLGLLVALGLGAVGLATPLLLAERRDRLFLLVPTVASLLIIVTLRYTMATEEETHRLRAALLVARQRETLARDVHDVLGHSLTVVAVKTELARKLLATDPDRARAELDDVLTLTRESLAEVRATVGGLRVPELPAQLAAARTALDAAGIGARVPGPDAADAVPADQRELFAWSLREAVTNVVRHSGAQRCTVTVGAGTLKVTDDGVGIPAGATGNGLTGLRERVSQAGGTLEIVPDRPGHPRPGTRVEVRL